MEVTDLVPNIVKSESFIKAPTMGQYVDVLNARIFYVECGTGQPILFIHDIPTHHLLWRHATAALQDHYRTIAPDLLGMGRSSQPDVEFDLARHCDIMAEFFTQLDLDDCILVAHGWGTMIAYDLIDRFKDKISALVLSEPYILPNKNWPDEPLPLSEFTKILHSPDRGKEAVLMDNVLLNEILPASVLNPLDPDILAAYHAPFLREASRRPLWDFARELPYRGEPPAIIERIVKYTRLLKQNNMPKLLLYQFPGMSMSFSLVAWCREQIPNLTAIEVGEGLHYPQEENPELYVEALQEWLRAATVRECY